MGASWITSKAPTMVARCEEGRARWPAVVRAGAKRDEESTGAEPTTQAGAACSLDRTRGPASGLARTATAEGAPATTSETASMARAARWKCTCP